MDNNSIPENAVIGTSNTHPLYVSFIPKNNLLNLNGTLGMTFAPGKNHYGIKSATVWKRNIDIDLLRLKNEYNINIIVTLLERNEFIELKIENLRKKIFEMSMDSIWYPIRDGEIPELGYETLAKFDTFISYLYTLLSNGNNIIVHCKGGLGRSGTITACVLVKIGYNHKEAIEICKYVRNRSVEKKIQQEFVQSYQNYLETIK